MRLSFFILFLWIYSNVHSQAILSGAEQLDKYIHKLEGKRVAIACNSSSMVADSHLVDILIARKINIVKIFAPEHGYRSDADAGAHIASGIDAKTGISILSLYGENKKPSKESLSNIDVIIYDIQDVGVRFYTYISTLQYLMEAAAESNIPILILDRPNPNGHVVDGPVLEPKYKSFVGMQAVPIIYGMTVGEYAKMLVGEKWLNISTKLQLDIILCQNYTHTSKVSLKYPPSPNLRTDKAIAFYPSLCLFEGTQVSVGRGTPRPFEMYGSPFMNKKYFKDSFIPKPSIGATKPFLMDKVCYGAILSSSNPESKFDLQYIIKAYKNWNGGKSAFFLKNLFFDKLAGNGSLRWQLIRGKSEKEIRKSWQPSLDKFKTIRKKYLLYP